MSADFREIAARTKLPEDVVLICMASDLVIRHEELVSELGELRDDPNAGIEGNGAAAKAEEIRELEERMRADTYPFRLRALRRPDFKALLARHPSRRLDDGSLDERDAQRGFNMDAVYDELVPVSIIDPVLTQDEMRKLVDEQLTDGQFIELGNAAFFLNRGTVSVPFSRAASAILRSSGGE